MDPTPVPWFTPTPLPTANPASLPFNLGAIDFNYEYAKMMEWGVQTWQTTNQSGALDLFQTIILLVIVLYGVFLLWQWTQEHD